MRTATAAAFALALAGVAGCGNYQVPTNAEGSLNLTPALQIAHEKLLFWGSYAAAAYLVLDPWAPNWEIEEARFPGDHYRMALRMKRYYAGGAGEARNVFHHRAKELALAGGFDGYRVVEYSESLESSVLGSQRVAEGVVALTRTE